jgi:hypothetical protein
MKYKSVSNATFTMFSYAADVQGCGTIRIMYPHLLLNQRRFNNVNFMFNWGVYFVLHSNWYKNFTCVQIQRPATKEQLEVVKMYKEKIYPIWKRPLYLEVDDLFFDIPEWNYASDYYVKNKKYVEEILRLVNGIIVSTEQLKKEYSKYNNTIKVIPNHLPKFIWGDAKRPQPKDPGEKLKVIYPCSQNHFAIPGKTKNGGDIDEKLYDFIIKTTDKYQWIFFGGRPIELEDYFKSGKIEYHGWRSTFEYPAHVKSLNADIGIAPLLDCRFNKSKSNIKQLEHVASGVPGVYSNLEPYKKTATLLSNNTEEFISHIEYLEDYDNRLKIWESDYKKVKEQLFWEDDGNLLKYVNTYLNLMGMEIEKE